MPRIYSGLPGKEKEEIADPYHNTALSNIFANVPNNPKSRLSPGT